MNGVTISKNRQISQVKQVEIEKLNKEVKEK